MKDYLFVLASVLVGLAIAAQVARQLRNSGYAID